MAGMLMRVLTSMLILAAVLSLTGCGDDRPEKIEKYQQLTEQRLTTLNTMLDDGQIRNANLLKQYSSLLKQQKPDLAPLVDELAKDATAEGPMFSSLKRRLGDAKNSANFTDLDQQLAEVENLYQATDPSLYNDMLSDPVNVIADMSEGKLARVNAISREAAALANNAEDFGPGSQLVGNPAYGSWQTDSSGMSFWAWYGMYSMFSNIFQRPIYYDRWSGNRGYSYYNDVGRYRYTSPKQAQAQEKTFEQTKKRFDSQGKRFDSPYSKSRTGSTSLSRESTSAPKANTAGSSSANKSGAQSDNKFRSNYSKDSSFRNSSNRTTRSVRRGK
ncbi:hypothetical protein HRJ35_20160 [Shewanella oneidensis MR-1]|uniref:Predicted lipoprotein n=1 Tax=Shewanella oneidensis (strain ATCC 700550 / JCM 31522 / CIP 106686 / LMG 19005 / NCIMB 14063 / MR-1) TaxID=211586 RepID=Q8EAY0_SHEON|nr:hypothetical protein [Shewanella oneidensis]AAN56742.1 predicted lipoprotein [Shewanella oneidensis MR-1]MDX5998883.1 hypothetical protein [Shewanella oneidensis]QKG98082.1 hypothetical protein HRJ35_20160 [Shewanella oneidensis MR-1]